jgi:hypothetical protein
MKVRNFEVSLWTSAPAASSLLEASDVTLPGVEVPARRASDEDGILDASAEQFDE